MPPKTLKTRPDFEGENVHTETNSNNLRRKFSYMCNYTLDKFMLFM